MLQHDRHKRPLPLWHYTTALHLNSRNTVSLVSGHIVSKSLCVHFVNSQLDKYFNFILFCSHLLKQINKSWKLKGLFHFLGRNIKYILATWFNKQLYKIALALDYTELLIRWTAYLKQGVEKLFLTLEKDTPLYFSVQNDIYILNLLDFLLIKQLVASIVEFLWWLWSWWTYKEKIVCQGNFSLACLQGQDLGAKWFLPETLSRSRI